jgi:Phytanoyl-CoA dioxygenase (PhyH)
MSTKKLAKRHFSFLVRMKKATCTMTAIMTPPSYQSPASRMSTKTATTTPTTKTATTPTTTRRGDTTATTSSYADPQPQPLAKQQCEPPTRRVDVRGCRRRSWSIGGDTIGARLMAVLLVLLLLLLFVTFLLVLVTGSVRYWYETFVVKAVDDLARTYDYAAVRHTDATYYQRPCSSADVLLLPLQQDDEQDFWAVPTGDGTTTVDDEIADHMMTKGVGMFHQLASPNTTHTLREYLLTKNQRVAENETIAVPPVEYRIAYALDPVEHPAVENFLRELTSHNGLRTTLQFLTGDVDPAITEMAAITSYAGAQIQHWHHDVIAEYGSAVQFGRTYTHTYSLFVALQDTTPAMGGTLVCPGTHYCGYAQNKVCAQHGYTPPNWQAGTGVLFNQQLGHAGGGHQPGQPERVMFVISFTRRPDWQYDGRVFASGLYCFAKWTIWGLTWQDLTTPPHWHTHSTLLRTLRSLGLWKPRHRHWGVDYITKQLLEWNLAENGMELFSLTKTAQWLQQQLHFPRFLHGEIFIVSDDVDFPAKPPVDIYHLYFRTTMTNVLKFALGLHVVVLGGAMLALAAVVGRSEEKQQQQQQQQQRLLRMVRQGLVLIYVVPTILAVGSVWTIRRSSWGRNILRLYRAPFAAVVPPGDNVDVGHLSSSSPPLYPTTVPERMDVLIGTRLNAAHLGSMNVWLDYHPGNVLFRRTIWPLGPYVNVLPHTLLYEIVRKTVYGRFLLQDWTTGNWIVLDDDATELFWEEELKKVNDPLLAALTDTIDQRIAFYRFDVSYRASSLAKPPDRL